MKVLVINGSPRAKGNSDILCDEFIRGAEEASPTYFLTMSGQMKVMIDRLLPRWQDLGGREAYVIVTGHDGKKGLERNAEDLVRILENLGDRVRQVIWGEHVWQKGEVIGTKAMEEAYLAGKGIGK